MNRRQFLKDVSLWCAGLTLTAPCFTIAETAAPVKKNASLVSVGRGNDYLALTSKILEPLGGMSAYTISR